MKTKGGTLAKDRLSRDKQQGDGGLEREVGGKQNQVCVKSEKVK